MPSEFEGNKQRKWGEGCWPLLLRLTEINVDAFIIPD